MTRLSQIRKEMANLQVRLAELAVIHNDSAIDRAINRWNAWFVGPNPRTDGIMDKYREMDAHVAACHQDYLEYLEDLRKCTL